MNKSSFKITAMALLLAAGSVTASTLAVSAFYKVGNTVFETTADDLCAVQPVGLICTIVITVNGQPQQVALYNTAATANAQGSVGLLRRSI